MSSSDRTRCKRCGAAVPSRSTELLCPACLMSGALAPTLGTAETATLGSGDEPIRYGFTEFPFEFGGYRVLGFLGRGGMGTVYEAEQIATGRRVALKMLGQQIDSPDLRQRFLREGRLAARVNHPNSLYIYGSEEIQGLPVITMEIAGGGTLRDRLKRRGPLPAAEAVDAILDVIAGLESAFEGGVLHRDVKPSNCFVSPDGTVKVGDFGLSVSTLAKTDSFVTAHGKIMGTPAYASPEQLRGDAIDVRADIYSVGATLFTLLTNRAPFEGDNAVQVVANAVNQKPTPLAELRDDLPPGLDRVVARCLEKEPGDRFADYAALRNALLPFSSREPTPASLGVRASVGWVDYLIAFLVPYVLFMLAVGGEELLIRPVVERTLVSAKYYLALFGIGFLYFALAEGIWGAGFGKRLKRLRVVRTDGRSPGLGRALGRILIPILSVEGVRMPLMMALIRDVDLTGAQVVLFVVAANVCAWIPVLLTLTARPANGHATVWDLVTGTRVVIRPTGTVRPAIAAAVRTDASAGGKDRLGPYEVIDAVVPGTWLVATDPVLRRQVWLLRRDGSGPSDQRRGVARPGRLRWLQTVESSGTTWDAFDATPGVPFTDLIEGGRRVPWSDLRHWLHDLAAELWAAAGDGTLPATLGLDHVWITERGHAVLLDEPWTAGSTPAETVTVADLAGQQRFLNRIAASAESTSLPVHARPVLANLEAGRFEKLSFLTGVLRGMLDRPADVGKGVRAGAIFMLPAYIATVVFVGWFRGGGAPPTTSAMSVASILVTVVLVVLGASAVAQLLEFPFRTTASHAIFRLAVVNADGRRARVRDLLSRWAIVWLPLFVPIALIARALDRTGPTALALATVVLLGWIGVAVHAALHPHRGLHDRLSGTWVVRR